jgi:BirA family biotin operon repressor/biotin-[acetyl-CoA-carboxylase] ligase
MNATEDTRAWAETREINLVYTTETGSTNNDAKAAASREDDEFVLYLTAHQTAGRGRGQNHWLDTGSGECLLSTWSLRVPSAPQAITGPRVGLALFASAARAWPSLAWGLKAPNDLYLAGQKVAGLLVESVSSGSQHRLLVGLGLNVANHPRSFSAATHLNGALDRAPDEGEWFRLLDEWRRQLLTAAAESLKPTLSPHACTELKSALNANPARPFVVEKVSPEGDLHHKQGVKKWTDL